MRRKTCVEGCNFQVGGTPIILLGTWAKLLFKIVYLKNVVEEKDVSQAKLNIWKFWSQSVSGKNYFICMNGVHATSLSLWYQNGLGKAIILRSCASLASELFIAYVSADVEMCLSFMVQSCSFLKCAMLFPVHYNAHLYRELSCTVCLMDMDVCCFKPEVIGFCMWSMPSVAIFWKFTLIIRNPKTNQNH